MKAIALFFILIISVLGQTPNEIRKIQLLPSPLSKSNVTKVIEVTREYVEKHLVGRKEFTFVDITDEVIHPANIENQDYPDPRRQTIVKPILEKITTATTKSFLAKLTSFSTRRSSQPASQESVLMIKKEIESIISKLPEERRKRFKVDLIVIRGYHANSITVKFEGTTDKDNHLLFGAHADDVGHPNAGADDDGSGTTCVFESFRVVAESTFNPVKSLVWLFYSAEESGLVGSTQIARDWKQRNVKVYGHLNYDMVGNHHRTNEPLAGRRLTMNTTPKITEFMYVLSKEYTKLDIDKWNFNGGSDHIPWFRNGYPSACLSERQFSPHYHTRTDKIENINFELVTEFARLGASYMIEGA